MNKFIKDIGLYLLLCTGIFLGSCGRSSGDNEELDNNVTKSVSNSKGTMNLENDSLTFNNIKAFEQRAIQKLFDLKDFFEILSNSRIDTTFKNQAIDMASELFSTNGNTITIILDEGKESKPQKAAAFFKSLQKGNLGKLSFEIHNISVIKNIKHLNTGEYKGAIKFELLISSKQPDIQKLSENIDMQCDIIAKKVQKQFGKETKQVWEVFLGDIFQVPK